MSASAAALLTVGGLAVAAPAAAEPVQAAYVDHYSACDDDVPWCYDYFQLTKFVPTTQGGHFRIITRIRTTSLDPECPSSSVLFDNRYTFARTATGDVSVDHYTQKNTVILQACGDRPAQRCELHVIYRVADGRLVRETVKEECEPL